MANDLRTQPKAHLWKPGQSGNPDGRPKGSKNKITLIKQALEGELRIQLGPHMADVLTRAIDMAKEGNEAMIKLLLDKTLPTTKSDDSESNEGGKIQIMIGKLPDRAEDVVVESTKGNK